MIRTSVLLAVAAVLTGLWIRDLVFSGTALTSMGLIADIVGALLLASVIGRAMVIFRQADPRVLGDAIKPLVERIPYRWARLFGSTDPRDADPILQENYRNGWWGAALLFLGFVLQLLGAWFPSGHAWR